MISVITHGDGSTYWYEVGGQLSHPSRSFSLPPYMPSPSLNYVLSQLHAARGPAKAPPARSAQISFVIFRVVSMHGIGKGLLGSSS